MTTSRAANEASRLSAIENNQSLSKARWRGGEAGDAAALGGGLWFNMRQGEDGWGWRAAWLPPSYGSVIGLGMIVAHDLMEHFHPADGSVEGEMRALGAALYIRGEAGVYRFGNDGADWADINANDLAGLLWEAEDPSRPEATWPTTWPKEGEAPLSSGYAEQQLQAGIIAGAELAVSAYGFDPDLVARRYLDGDDLALLAYLRAGYLEIRDAYRDLAPFQLACVFNDLTADAQALLVKHQGQDVKLWARYDRRALSYELAVYRAGEARAIGAPAG